MPELTCACLGVVALLCPDRLLAGQGDSHPFPVIPSAASVITVTVLSAHLTSPASHLK